MLALTAYAWFKSFHVLAAVIWVGGGATLAVLSLLTMREDDPVRGAQFAKQASWVGMRIFTPMSFILLGFGFAMIEKYDLGYGQFWIQFGLGVWGASTLTGIFFLGPQSKKLATLMADRPASDPEVKAGIRRLLLVARLDVALLLLAVFDMAAKPFS